MLRLLLCCALTVVPAAFAADPPADAEQATKHLDASARHGEWVAIDSEGDKITAWMVYPERAGTAPVVVVIHEIFGLTDWIRAVADQFAAEGFLAIAPDLLSGKGPDGSNTPEDQQEAVKLVRSLDAAEVIRRLNATAAYATALPSATDKYGSVGFCWGGGKSFAWAVAQPELDAAVVYYGASPDPAEVSKVGAAVLGLYGGDDARVNSTIPPVEAEMERLGKTFEKQIYEGAGHAFLRQQQDRDGANMRASEQAWDRTIAFFKERLE